ncbi:MAG: MBL fold metallo-hydrolase [Gammaproteobacteria bacterium]|nr:MBL fold metallo-hydrolase [Gammaproteobacteria bacterium]
MKIAEKWFQRRQVDDQITLLWEPYVDPLLRCNIWHVRGGQRDLLVDTGMGICSLKDEMRDLLGKPIIALATHTHLDHMGSMYEFDTRVVHRLEGQILEQPPAVSLNTRDWPRDFVASIEDSGYPLKNEELISAYPRDGFDPRTFHTPSAVPTWLVEEGSVIDLGQRQFEVLHLPGHSPGSIGLWEAKTGTLFSGDAIYDGPLLDTLEGCDIKQYLQTMERLRSLPVTVIHGGHDPSFGRERLIQITTEYIQRRTT